MNIIGHANNIIKSPIVELHRVLSGSIIRRVETYAVLDAEGNIYYFSSTTGKIKKIMIDGIYRQICLINGIYGPALCALNEKNEVIYVELEKYNGESECVGYCERKGLPFIQKMCISRNDDEVLGIDADGRVHIVYTKIVDNRLLKQKQSFLNSLPCVKNIVQNGSYTAWIDENGCVGFACKNSGLGNLEKFNTKESVIDIARVNSDFAILYSSGKVDCISCYYEKKNIFKIPLRCVLGVIVDKINNMYGVTCEFEYLTFGITTDGYLCTTEGICEVKNSDGKVHKIRLFE